MLATVLWPSTPDSMCGVAVTVIVKLGTTKSVVKTSGTWKQVGVVFLL